MTAHTHAIQAYHANKSQINQEKKNMKQMIYHTGPVVLSLKKPNTKGTKRKKKIGEKKNQL